MKFVASSFMVFIASKLMFVLCSFIVFYNRKVFIIELKGKEFQFKSWRFHILVVDFTTIRAAYSQVRRRLGKLKMHVLIVVDHSSVVLQIKYLTGG